MKIIRIPSAYISQIEHMPDEDVGFVFKNLFRASSGTIINDEKSLRFGLLCSIYREAIQMHNKSVAKKGEERLDEDIAPMVQQNSPIGSTHRETQNNISVATTDFLGEKSENDVQKIEGTISQGEATAPMVPKKVRPSQVKSGQVRSSQVSNNIDFPEISKKKPIEKKNEELETFDIFRKTYRDFGGKVKGLDFEFNNFKKKNKNYKEILPKLIISLQEQNKIRNAKRQAKQFIPYWKNLTTWINQACWEEEENIDGLAEKPTPQNMTIEKIIQHREANPDAHWDEIKHWFCKIMMEANPDLADYLFNGKKAFCEKDYPHEWGMFADARDEYRRKYNLE